MEEQENLSESHQAIDQQIIEEKTDDNRPDVIRTNTQADMEVVKNEKNFEVQIMHKDQHIESIKYMSKKDIYEIFKTLTVNLVLKKPNDPIKNMIDQLKEIQQEERHNIEQQESQSKLKLEQINNNNST